MSGEATFSRVLRAWVVTTWVGAQVACSPQPDIVARGKDAVLLPPTTEPKVPEGCAVETIERQTCTSPDLFQHLADERCTASEGFYVPYLVAKDDACEDGSFARAEYWCCPDV